VYRKLHR